MRSTGFFILSFAVSASLHATSNPSTITLVSSANPSVYGHAVTFTASVSPTTATGKVTFYSGASILETEPLVAGVATHP